MALVPTVTSNTIVPDQAGTMKRVLGTLAFDNLYQTNGMSLPLTKLGLTTCTQMWVGTSSGYVFQYVVATSKVKAYYVPTGTNATAAALGECAVNTDLSALTAVPFEGFGT
jgi:hypothetical protein